MGVAAFLALLVRPGPRDESDVRLREFQELVAQHKEQMYRVAYRMVGNHEDAEDLVQDTLLDALRAFQRFAPGSAFDRWIYRIMLNNVIDWRRRRAVRAISLDEPGRVGEEGGPQEVADSSRDPAQVAFRDVLDEPVEKALTALQPDIRMAVILRDIEGLTYEEVAQAMHCPVGTVRSRLHRGREELRTRLASLWRKQR